MNWFGWVRRLQQHHQDLRSAPEAVSILSLDERLDALFTRREARLHDRLARLRRVALHCPADSAWWSRLWAACREGIRKHRLERALQVQSARRSEFFAIAHAAIEAASTHERDVSVRAHESAATDLLRRAARVSRRIADRPDVVEHFAPKPGTAPRPDPANVEDLAYLERMEKFADVVFDSIVRQVVAGDAARQVLAKLMPEGATPCGSVSGSFATNTFAAVVSLLAPPPSTEAGSLADLMRRCVTPAALASPEAWLVLWTGLGATARYAEQAHGNRAGEVVKGETWRHSWQAQMASWPPEVAAAIGVGADELGTVTLSVAGGGAETATGSDLIVLLWVRRPGVSAYCRAVNIQFKRIDGPARVMNVERQGWRQFDTLATLAARSGGKWSAIYGLLLDRFDGLSTVACVPIEAVREVLRRDPLESTRDARPSRPSDFRLRWDEVGQSLPTALATHLCLPQAESYADVGAALTAMEDLSQHALKPYVVIQGVGVSARTIQWELERNQRLLQRMGLEVDNARQLGRDPPDRDRGRERSLGPRR
jgi:hypothetical protein